MVVCGDVRRTYGEVRSVTRGAGRVPRRAWRSACAASATELERWESGQDAVALVLHNCPEYIEAMLGVLPGPGRAVQRQPALPSPAEIAGLFADARRPRPSSTTAATARWSPRPRATATDVVLVDVDDGSGVDAAAGQHRLRGRRGATPVDRPCPVPSPDDLYLVCTGGTTGRPKAVLWRQADIYVSAMGGSRGRHRRVDRRRRPTADAGGRGSPCRRSCTPPRSGRRSAGLHAGAHGRAPRRLAARSTPARSSRSPSASGSFLMSIVGDAYARPLVDELRTRPLRPVGSLRLLGTGGAATSEHSRRRCSSCCPTS